MTSDCADRKWLARVALERMHPRDLAEVLHIERSSFPSAWTPESYLRELRNASSYYLVAKLEGRVIGYAGMWVIADEAHISTIAVDPVRRRCGLGETMMRHLIEVARTRQAEKVTLEVREQNLGAQAMYRKLGFEMQALIPRYYGDTGENALVMKKTLAAQETAEPSGESG